MKLRAAALAVSLLGFALLSSAATPDDAPLEAGKPLTPELSGLQTRTHALSLRAGQCAVVDLRHRGIDFTARLLAPDGSVIVMPVPERAGDEERVTFVASMDGAYRVRIRAPYRERAARYEIALVEIRQATEHDRRMQKVLFLASESERLMRSSEPGQAIPLASEALDILRGESGPLPPAVAARLFALGEAYHELGAHDKAEPLLRQAWELDQESLGAEHPRTLVAMQRLGAVYGDSGEYARAEPLLRRACELAAKRSGPDHPAMVSCLIDLSTLDQNRGDLSQAEEKLHRALAIGERMMEPADHDVLHALNDLAVLYNTRQEYTRAEPLLNRVIELSKNPQSQELDSHNTLDDQGTVVGLALWNLALIAQEHYRDNVRALDLYTRAEAWFEEHRGPDNWQVAAILNNVANIHKANGDYAKALELHQRVHAMWEKALGEFHSKTVLSLGNIARTYASMGDAENAVKFEKLADEALEKNLALNLAAGSERQKLAYFNSVAERTDRTISLQVTLAPESQAAVRLAALTALQRKGRVLDSISLGLTSLRQRMQPGDQAALDSWTAVGGEYARLALRGPGLLSQEDYRTRLAKLAADQERAEAEVNRRSAEFVSSLTMPVTLEAVQAAIPWDAALVEFATWRPFNPRLNNTEAYGERRYIAYVLRSGGDVRWKELGPADEIDHLVKKFRNSLADPASRDINETARALDRRILEPVRPLLGDARHLLISPEGPLNLAPFSALIDEQGRYLVERYLLTYLSSGRDLLRMQVARASRSGPVIIADPAFDTPAGQKPEPQAVTRLGPSAQRRSITAGEDLKDLYFAPLAGASLEARAIGSLFPDARVLTGRMATEQALKQVDAPSILHIATHGFFLPASAAGGNPLLRSGLALAGANGRSGGTDDGIFTALEASGLNLWGTRLVTLSACDTGLGEVRSAEGVFGLRRAFVLAGAETLVMSLWPVSDYVTRQTMTAFYGGLEKGLGRGEALRQAQLAILRQKGREHPFYWASFIEAGEWGRLSER